MKDEVTIAALEKKRACLLRLLNSGRPLLASTLSEIRTRCGKPSCHCASGEGHAAHLLTRRENGRTRTIYVPSGLVDEVRKWVGEYRRLKELMLEITIIGEEIVRGHVKAKRKSNKE